MHILNQLKIDLTPEAIHNFKKLLQFASINFNLIVIFLIARLA
jgi:hypothetical protein